MSSQGVTRKRPAPGTTPTVHPQLSPISNYPTANPGSQLSNDQFLQWGQNPPNVITPPYTDAGSYNVAPYTTNQDVPGATVTASTQLARRQLPNQLVNRGRGYEQTPSVYSDHSGGAGEPGGWGESLDELYRRALVAKREAQAKRKQIPPFVQKLSRYATTEMCFVNAILTAVVLVFSTSRKIPILYDGPMTEIPSSCWTKTNSPRL